MGVRNLKPTSPGRRGMQVSDWSDLTLGNRNRPERTLLEQLRKTGGRNHHGCLTSRPVGGGHKSQSRTIDFTPHTAQLPATVVADE